jgi:tetratricopeptide (TPR) repeat protein
MNIKLILIWLIACIPFGLSAQQDPLAVIKHFIDSNELLDALNAFNELKPAIAEMDSAKYQAYWVLGNKIALKMNADNLPRLETLSKDLISFYGEHTLEAGILYHKMGDLHYQNGNDALYLEYLKKACPLIKSTQGETDKSYIRCLNSLGWALLVNGNYRESEKVYSDAIRIKDRKEERDLQYARLLGNLADVQTRLYKLDDARENFQRTLIVKKLYEDNYPNEYAKSLAKYVSLLQKTNNFEEALSIIDSAIALHTLPDIHDSGYLSALELHDAYRQLKAGILHDVGRNQEAIALYQELLESRLNYEGKSSQPINKAKIQLSLSNIFFETGDYSSAVEYSRIALASFKKLKGENHPEYAISLRTHADHLSALDKTEKLDSFYVIASRIAQRTYGKKHIEYFKSEFAYLKYLIKTRQIKKAEKVLEAITDILEGHIELASNYLTVYELMEYLDLYKDYYMNLARLAYEQSNNPMIIERAFDASLFLKGYMLQAAQLQKKSIEDARQIGELGAKKREAEEKRMAILNKKSSENFDSELYTIQQSIEQIDAEITRSMSKLKKDERRIKWAEVEESLLDNDAAIDFVRIDMGKETENQVYAAFILRKGFEYPIFQPLFSENEIRNLFQGRKMSSANIMAMYDRNNRGMIKAEDANKATLKELIWDKLSLHLVGIDRINYVADGIIHTIALHAISTGNRQFTSNNIQFVAMTTFNNLLRTPEVRTLSARQNYLVGGVDFGGSEIAAINRGGSNLDPLFYSDSEVENAANLLNEAGMQVSKVKGFEASKGRVLSDLQKTDSNPFRIIHFATHGLVDNPDLWEIKKTQGDSKSYDLDMYRSGIVLANYNLTGQPEGLLTAAEIANLDLRGTELVILSACESGLGYAYGGEGVYGLQRAFKIAGAKYILMTLWEVNDQKTTLFMESFYDMYIKENKSIPDAYFATMNKLKLIDPVAYWAPFVLLN